MGLPTSSRYGQPWSSYYPLGREIGFLIGCETHCPLLHVVPPTGTQFPLVSYTRVSVSQWTDPDDGNCRCDRGSRRPGTEERVRDFCPRETGDTGETRMTYPRTPIGVTRVVADMDTRDGPPDSCPNGRTVTRSEQSRVRVINTQTHNGMG